MEAGRRLLRRESGRKDSFSSLQEIWAELPESPMHEKNGDGPGSNAKSREECSSGSGKAQRGQPSKTSRASRGRPSKLNVGDFEAASPATISDESAETPNGSGGGSSNQDQDLVEEQRRRRRLQRASETDELGTCSENESADVDDDSDDDGDGNDGLLLRSSASFRMSTGKADDLAMSPVPDVPPPLPQRPRKGSDSSLLGAKKLIESALDQKSRTERRLSAQLERLEAQIRKSFGSVGGNSRRRSAESARTRRALASPDEVAEDAYFGELDLDGAAHHPQQQQGHQLQVQQHPLSHCRRRAGYDDDADEDSSLQNDEDSENISDGDETLVSSMEDAFEDPENVQLLQQAHATLVEEHQGLQDEIARMNGQLAWIESQLQATKGHAQCLSRSTSDWAGMMRQIARSTAVQEQLRVIQQGSMVIKHSAKKRGCGPRFLVFDMDEGQLLWSKSISGAGEICRQINQRERDTLERNANPFAVAHSDVASGAGSSQAQVGAGANISCFPLANVAAVLHGEEEITSMIAHDAAHAHRLSANIEAVCRDRGNLIVAVLTSDGNPLVFEFFNADLAATFALGLRLCHDTVLGDRSREDDTKNNAARASGAANAVHGAEKTRQHGSRKAKNLPHRNLHKVSSSSGRPRGIGEAHASIDGNVEHVETKDCSDESIGAGAARDAGLSQITPVQDRRSQHQHPQHPQQHSSRSATSASGRQLPFRWPHGGFETPESCSFKSDRTTGSKSSGVRSLNVSFELRSLEEVGAAHQHHNRGRASQLQKDLAATQTREAYQDVLIGVSNAKSQLVLPLKSNRAARNLLADQTQVLKDLSRERAILLNAAWYELGSVEQTAKFARKLRDLLSDTIRQLAPDDLTVLDDSHVEFWTRELLLASSRTVIEGDVYSVCHRMLTGPPEVLLCPSTTHVASPIEIFVAPDGLVTIESATAYRVVRVSGDDHAGSPEVWVHVHARCIEHLYVNSPLDLNEETDERNIRSLRLEFEAETDADAEDDEEDEAPETD